MKFLIMAAVVLATLVTAPAYANTQKQTQINETIRQITSLIDGGEQMNLKATAELFGEPKLYDQAIFEQVPSSPVLMYYYTFDDKVSPLKAIRYRIGLDMSEGYGTASSSVEFGFKDGYCPTPADYEKVIGTEVMTTQIPNSPDLITGRGSSYAAHFITTKRGKSLMVVGCRVMTTSDVKLS